MRVMLFVFTVLMLNAAEIRLSSSDAAADREYSAMAWDEDRLILVPQYPDGAVFSVGKAPLLRVIDNNTTLRLTPLRFDDTKIKDAVRGYEGIALLEGRGALLVTDRHPRSVLSFVPFR